MALNSLPALQTRAPDVGNALAQGQQIQTSRLNNQLAQRAMKREDEVSQATSQAARDLLGAGATTNRLKVLAGPGENPLPDSAIKLAGLAPERFKQLMDMHDRADAKEQERMQMNAAATAKLALGVLGTPPQDRPAAYMQALDIAKNMGMDVTTLPPEYSPAAERALEFKVLEAMTVKDLLDKRKVGKSDLVEIKDKNGRTVYARAERAVGEEVPEKVEIVKAINDQGQEGQGYWKGDKFVWIGGSKPATEKTLSKKDLVQITNADGTKVWAKAEEAVGKPVVPEETKVSKADLVPIKEGDKTVWTTAEQAVGKAVVEEPKDVSKADLVQIQGPDGKPQWVLAKDAPGKRPAADTSKGPARVQEASWLVEVGIAEDLDSAYKMTRERVRTSESEKRAKALSWAASQKNNLGGQLYVTPEETNAAVDAYMKWVAGDATGAVAALKAINNEPVDEPNLIQQWIKSWWGGEGGEKPAENKNAVTPQGTGTEADPHVFSQDEAEQQAQFDALPPGAWFINPADGQKLRKRKQ